MPESCLNIGEKMNAAVRSSARSGQKNGMGGKKGNKK